MSFPRRRFPVAITLAFGLALGWGLASLPRPVVRAGGGDRWGESILTSGPILVRYNEGTKVQVPQDALYYLDYKGGRLLATVPSFRQSFGAAQMIDRFAERDLVADFKLDLDNGLRPHFLMTTGALGSYSEGCSPLFVFESTTNQVAVYKLTQQQVGMSARPKFELVEIHPIGGPPAPPAR
ncbi:MAG: hypothetical protein JOZ53_26515 [Planctomycetaceae bacterium]|nr:hypothetical protein [Planctomycetaceae bacterium]